MERSQQSWIDEIQSKANWLPEVVLSGDPITKSQQVFSADEFVIKQVNKASGSANKTPWKRLPFLTKTIISAVLFHIQFLWSLSHQTTSCYCSFFWPHDQQKRPASESWRFLSSQADVEGEVFQTGCRRQPGFFPPRWSVDICETPPLASSKTHFYISTLPQENESLTLAQNTAINTHSIEAFMEANSFLL